jgi:hypothetical protein
MAHYAFLDKTNTVVNVIVGKNENDNTGGIVDWEKYYGDFVGQICKRTSYNTYGGKHLKGGTPLRKNYAGVGFIYDEKLDAFIPPQTFDSWILDKETCLWQAPVEYPSDGKIYYWNEENLIWELAE